jgi:Ca-activated chloride channel family protein
MGAPAGAGTWANLWYTPDQQAQQALQAGDAHRAADLFTDPRRRAYAEIKSDQYAAAAKRLQPFDDAESQYNRGNALARLGDLKSAIDAYDAALKQTAMDSPLGKDAKHNRDLVARQLQKQQQQSQQGEQKQQKEQSKNNPDKSQSEQKQGSGQQSQGAQQPDQQQRAEQSEQNGSQQRKDAEQQKKPEQQNGQSGAEQANTQPKEQTSPQSSAPSGAASQQQTDKQQSDKQQSDKQRADKEQAQRDVAETMQQSQAQSSATREDGKRAAVNEKAAPADDLTKPPTEQALALDQWLRQIPDDPGGLLRRKFLIEHMLKERGEQP